MILLLLTITGNSMVVHVKALFLRRKRMLIISISYILKRINYLEKDSFKMNMDLFDDVKRMDKRQFFYQVLSFGMIVSSALMIWKGLMVVTGSESPIVVVLSDSMEPAFH